MYRVRKGDSLHRIAAHFDVTVIELQRWNDLKHNHRLQPGRALTVYVKNS